MFPSLHVLGDSHFRWHYSRSTDVAILARTSLKDPNVSTLFHLMVWWEFWSKPVCNGNITSVRLQRLQSGIPHFATFCCAGLCLQQKGILKTYMPTLQVLWSLLDTVWGCMLATYRSYGVCWTQLGAVCCQPTSLMGLVGPSLGLYVGNLQVLCGLLGLVGPSLGLYVGNLQVLCGLLDPAGGCMLATYRSYGACWTQLGAVCWQPAGLMGLVGPSLGLYLGNLHVLWGLLDPA